MKEMAEGGEQQHRGAADLRRTEKEHTLRKGENGDDDAKEEKQGDEEVQWSSEESEDSPDSRQERARSGGCGSPASSASTVTPGGDFASERAPVPELTPGRKNVDPLLSIEEQTRDAQEEGDDDAKEKKGEEDEEFQWSGEGSGYVPDYPFDPYMDFMKPLCQRLLLAVPSWMTANMVTGLSIVAEVLGASLFFILAANNRLWLGHLAMGLGVFLNHVLDDMDGMVARARNQSSKGGEFLDHASDRLFFMLAYLVNGYASAPAVADVLSVMQDSWLGADSVITSTFNGSLSWGVPIAWARGVEVLDSFAAWHIAYNLSTRFLICTESATGTYKMWVQLRSDKFRVCSSGEWFRLGTAAFHLSLALAHGFAPVWIVWGLHLSLFIFGAFIAIRQVNFQLTRNLNYSVLQRFGATDIWVGVLHTGLLLGIMLLWGKPPTEEQKMASVLLDLSVTCLASCLHAYIIYRYIIDGFVGGPSARSRGALLGAVAWILLLPCAFLAAPIIFQPLELLSRALATLGVSAGIWSVQFFAYFHDISRREVRQMSSQQEPAAVGGPPCL